jgi:opacity protein-like surface antigen
MKLIKVTFIAFLVLLFSSINTFSQPKFIAHVTGGLSVPLPDLQGNIDLNTLVAPTTEKNFLMKLGIHFGADAKYAFDKKGNFRGVFGIGYNMFINPADLLGIGTTIKFRPTIGILTLSLGPEYAFLPKGKFNPFVGVDFTANFINGSYEYDPETAPFNNFTIESAARFGVQFGLGADIALGKNIGLVVGFKYNLANLIGKDSDTSKLTGTTRALNDKEYTSGGTTISAKNISYVQIYSGLAFFFGHPKKVVKK